MVSVTNITGFQRARRLAAEKAAKELSLPEHPIQVLAFKNEEVVNAMTIEEVRDKLLDLNVSFQPNTGEAKLKAKLVGVLNGAE